MTVAPGHFHAALVQKRALHGVHPRAHVYAPLEHSRWDGCTFADFVFSYHIDKASPLLMKACAIGQHIANATVTQRRAGNAQHEFLVIPMTDVLVVSVSNGGNVEGEATSETVALAFAKVDVEYKPQKADGSLDAGSHFKYDLKANNEG